MKIAKLIAGGLAVLALATFPLAAEAKSGLGAEIDGRDPKNIILTLKNSGDEPCQAAETATGTIAITRMQQDGREINPSPVEVGFEEGLDRTLPGTLKTLQPGETLKIPLKSTDAGGGKIAVQSISWSPEGGAYALLYMAEANRPVQVELNYSVPIPQPEGGALLCQVALASTLQGQAKIWPVVVTVVLIVLLLILIIFLLFLFIKRQKNKNKKTAAAIVALAAGGLILAMPASPAEARITVPESVQSAWNNCLSTLRAHPDLTGPVLGLIDSPSVNIIIDPVNTGGAEMMAWPDGSYHIEWNINDRHAYAGTGGAADPCTSIYHELYHVLDMENRTYSRTDCAGSGIETKEVMATRAQNALRARLGMPERSHYGDRPLPPGNCNQRPDAGACRSGNCARTTGDPHLLTFDHLRYDFQAAGEFVLAKGGGLEVQVRQQPWEDSRSVALTTAAVVKTAGYKIQAGADGYKLSIKVDGRDVPLQAAVLDDGTSLTPRQQSGVDITTKDGTTVSIITLGKYGIDVIMDPAPTLKGQLQGLLGNFDGDSANDLKLKDKDQALKPEFRQLYPQFADSWRVSDESSLFSYGPGLSTATYTDRSFPYEETDTSRIPGYQTAREFCQRLGITDEGSLADCALDLAITGRPEFARSALRAQTITAGTQIDTQSETYLLQARAPGQTAKVEFQAKKDEKIFVDIFSSDFPSNCGAFSLRDNADKTLESACIINGKGHLETTVIPADGTYSLQLRGSENTTGEARVRLYRVKDQIGNISPDGSAVEANLQTPGMESRFSFQAAAGQRLFLNTSGATLPSQCSPLRIDDPAGKTISSGCIINGKGHINTTVIPASGTYSIVVNPSDVTVGKVSLHLTTASVITKDLGVGGQVTLQFSKPGDVAEVRFSGSAGQKVFVDILDSSLPSQCGGFSLLMPGGQSEDGCIIGKEDTLEEGGIVLPANGSYTVRIDPPEDHTGQLTLRLR